MDPIQIGTLTVHRDDDPGKRHPCTVWIGLLAASAAITFGALYMLAHIIIAIVS